MFAYRARHYKGRLIAGLLATVFAVLPLAGCGDDEPDVTVTAGAETESTGSADAPDTAEADAADLEVIEGWSEALTEGDVEAAAAYFATPSTAENGPLRSDIESLKDAISFNSTLPCGAIVVSARTQGELTTATFELSERPGGACGEGCRRHRLDLLRHRERQDRRMAPDRRRVRASGRRRRRECAGLTPLIRNLPQELPDSDRLSRESEGTIRTRAVSAWALNGSRVKAHGATKQRRNDFEKQTASCGRRVNCGPIDGRSCLRRRRKFE